MWPYVGDYVQDILWNTVQPKVQESLPASLKSFKFVRIDLGDIVSRFFLLSPRFSKGLCVTVRRPSVCPSVGPSVCPSGRPSVRQQFTSISSYTIDATITKLICMIPLCIQVVATYLKFFYYFQFWNNSDFSDFTQNCNFSGNLSRNWFKFYKCMGECHIHHISNGFYRVTFRSPPKMEV